MQFIARTVGGHAYSVSLPVALKPGDPHTLARVLGVGESLDAGFAWGVVAAELPVDQARQGSRTGYVEYDWDNPPLPERFVVTGGSLPAVPRDVMVSQGTGHTVGDHISLFGGRLDLRVVGMVEDRYGRDRALVFGAPGEWQSWEAEGLADRYPSALANVELYWSGAGRDRAAQALGALLGLDASVVDQWIQDKERLAAARRDIASMLLPITGLAPLLLVPGVVGLICGGILGAWNVRTRTTLFMIGVPTRVGHAAIGGCAVIVLVLGWLAGSTVGALGGVLGRPFLAALVPYELAPLTVPWQTGSCRSHWVPSGSRSAWW